MSEEEISAALSEFDKAVEEANVATAPSPPPPPPPLTDAAKEQVKLRATYFNQLGVALFAVGGLAPILKASTDAKLSPGAVSTIVISSIVCFVLSGVLHYRAYEHLRELDK